MAQRALHVGLIPALNSFTMILSDLNKEIAAEVPDRNEKLLKELNAVRAPFFTRPSSFTFQYPSSLPFIFHFSTLSLPSSHTSSILSLSPQLYLLTGTCCLLDPQLVQDTSQFYITQSVWIDLQDDVCVWSRDVSGFPASVQQMGAN